MSESNDLAAVLRLIAAADPSAFADETHLRSLLHDLAPAMPPTQLDHVTLAVRYRLPDLVRGNAHQTPEHVAGLFAARVGVLDVEPFREVITAFAEALDTSMPRPTVQTVAAPRPQDQPPAPPSQPHGAYWMNPAVGAAEPKQFVPHHLAPQPAVGQHRHGRRRWIAASVAAVAVAGGVTAGVLLWPGPTPKPTPVATSLAAPSDVQTQVNSTGVVVTWHEVPGAVGYQLYRDGKTALRVSGAGNTEVHDSAATTAGSHTYTVKAIDTHDRFGSPSTPATSLTLSATAQALAARIPAGLVVPDSCMDYAPIEKTYESYGVTELRCTPETLGAVTPNWLFIAEYPSAGDLRRFTTDATRTIPLSTGPLCQTAATSNVGYWKTYDGKATVGRFYCSASGSSSHLAWIYPQQLIRLQIESEDNTPIDQLNAWWNTGWQDQALTLQS